MSARVPARERRTARRSLAQREGTLHDGQAYIAYGSGSPLVYFRGLSPSAANPRGFARRSEARFLAPLAQHWTVYAVNNPPGLRSGTTMAELAAAHAAALEAALGTAAHVLGVSTGGAIAQQLAVDHPRLIRKLALVVTAYQLGPEGRDAQRRYADLLAQGRPRQGLQALAPVMAQSRLGKWLVARLLWLAGALVRVDDPSGMAIALRAEDGLDVGGRLHEIDVPTLVVGGERDRLYPPPLVARTAELIPRSKLIMYPGRDHRGVLTDRRLFHDLIAFLAADQGAPEEYST